MFEGQKRKIRDKKNKADEEIEKEGREKQKGTGNYKNQK